MRINLGKLYRKCARIGPTTQSTPFTLLVFLTVDKFRLPFHFNVVGFYFLTIRQLCYWLLFSSLEIADSPVSFLRF